MNLNPFYLNTSQVKALTKEQLHEADYRCARDFGSRAGYSPISYILLLLSVTLFTDSGWSFFTDYWFLVIAVYALNLGRFYNTQKLSRAEKNHYKSYLCRYYILSLCTALLWGVIMAIMIWIDHLQNFSYLLLSLTIAITGGAIGTMTSYVRTSLQFNVFIWMPIIFVLALLSYTDTQDALLLVYLITLMLFFVITQARRIAYDNQNGMLRQILLETQSNELILALKTIEQQQIEVKSHRDHLQDLVNEKTIDLIKSKEKAEQADKAKSEFLANMSHELRTPLHSILSFSHFGLTRIDQVDKEKIMSYFEKINYSGKIQLNLVNDLLDLSRLESNKETLFLSQCDLPEITQSIIDELSSLLEEKKITLIFDKAETKADISGEKNKIEQLLRNLIGNAIKFSPENTEIQIKIYTINASIRLEIKDQGPGIPDADKNSVFDKFNQSSRTRIRTGGTGLGLAICAQIMRLHNGEIWVESSIKGDDSSGALFIVVFPAV